MTDPAYTPEDLAAAAAQVQPPPVGTGLPQDTPDRVAAGGTAAEVDVAALLAQFQAQQQAMAAEIARLKKQIAAPDGVHTLEGTAQAIRDLIATHVDHGISGGPELVRLAEDLVDAARNAVASGDVSAVRTLGGKVERALLRVHPGGGDHHYFFHALNKVRADLPDAADLITAPQPSGATAVGGGKPAPVITGSVTG